MVGNGFGARGVSLRGEGGILIRLLCLIGIVFLEISKII